jgi:hypothetical protein
MVELLRAVGWDGVPIAKFYRTGGGRSAVEHGHAEKLFQRITGIQEDKPRGHASLRDRSPAGGSIHFLNPFVARCLGSLSDDRFVGTLAGAF